jgi:flagellar hook protein FlgE
MSINGSMQTGVTALNANSVALGSISNNIANVNTTAYKRLRTEFADLVSPAATRRAYTSGGVNPYTTQAISVSGELNPSASNYHLGVQGQGFFMTAQNADSLGMNNDLYFTRDGSFTTDTDGYLRNTPGYYLLGWVADDAGIISTSSTDTSLLQPINVGNISPPAEASTQFSFVSNLDSRTPVSTAVTAGTYNPASTTASMSVYNAATSVGTKPDATTTVVISDSLGQPHSMNISFLRQNPDAAGAAAGRVKWAYEVSSVDVQDAGGNTLATGGLGHVGTGTLYFDTSGNIDLINSTGPLIAGLTIGASTGGPAPKWHTNFSAAAQTVTTGVGSALSTLTSNANDSITTNIFANGTEFSKLSKIEVGDDGVVTAFYANGNQRNIAKLALATFINPDGLKAVSGNAYELSIESGSFTIREPGLSGAGLIASNSLENSTVDLSYEFTNLITTQRAYSAASRIITTADEMLQELLNIKR